MNDKRSPWSIHHHLQSAYRLMNQTLTIGRPRLQETQDGMRAEVHLDNPVAPFELFYEVSGSRLSADGTPYFAGLLPLAMKRGWNIVSKSPVSAQLLAAVDQIQDIFQLWDRETGRIRIEADVINTPQAAASRGEACFFSGGVDSWFSALKNHARLQSLIFVRGFDIALENETLGGIVLQQMRRAAGHLQRGLIEVRTNFRELSDRILPWSLAHGAGLASVALLLAPSLHTVYLPATHHYGDIFPWGSHPILDHLWSSEAVRIQTDGLAATRFQKMQLLADHPISLRTLRVCYSNREALYNCGRCEKCLRAKVSLYALGVLHLSETFDHKLSLRHIAKLRLGDYSVVGNFTKSSFIKDNVEALRRTRRDHPHLIHALHQALRRPGPVWKLKRSMRRFFHRSTLRRAMAQFRSAGQHG
jgi:hypothetical protein